MSIQKTLIRSGMQAALGLSAWLASHERLRALSDRVMRNLARSAVRMKGIRRSSSVADLGEQWQKAFPSRKQIPITAVTEDTVYAEIHTPCPLRGTGDVHACHRMMEFDREVLRHADGQFIVLESQATPGRTFCKVAMRRAGADTSDLTPAHLRD